jgi:2-dehydropantoate 2-reductase
MTNLKILSFGAGAIGTYIGGSLSLAGEQVVFVEQPALADELRQRGLRLNLTVDKRRTTNPILALSPSAFVVCAQIF